MSDNNPFGSTAGQYATTVQYGGAQAARPAPGEAPAAGNLIKDTTTAAFAADVIQESRRQPVLVDFWAPWCGPCKQLTPQLEKAVKAAGGKVKLVKMNIDDHPSIAGQLGIQSIPAVIAFKDGQPVDGFMGAIPESQIGEFINKVGGKTASALDGIGGKLSAADIKKWLTATAEMEGKLPKKPTASMATWMKSKKLTDADVDALVAYMASLK